MAAAATSSVLSHRPEKSAGGSAAPATQWRQGFACLREPLFVREGVAQSLRVHVALDAQEGSLTCRVLCND